MYGVFGREITKNTVIYGAYTVLANPTHTPTPTLQCRDLHCAYTSCKYMVMANPTLCISKPLPNSSGPRLCLHRTVFDRVLIAPCQDDCMRTLHLTIWPAPKSALNASSARSPSLALKPQPYEPTLHVLTEHASAHASMPHVSMMTDIISMVHVSMMTDVSMPHVSMMTDVSMAFLSMINFSMPHVSMMTDVSMAFLSMMTDVSMAFLSMMADVLILHVSMMTDVQCHMCQ